MSTEPTPPAAPAPQPAAVRVRKPVIAGSWYPGQRDALARAVDAMLDAAPAGDCAHQPLALVSPHAGYRFSGPTAAHAFAQVRGCSVRRVWVLGVTHHMGLRGVGLYDVDAFRTPLGDLPLDREVIDRLAQRPGFELLPDSGRGAGDSGEHSIEIELPLLQRALGAFELVPLLVGHLDPSSARALAAAIRTELGPGDLVVASSDFTHYGPNYGFIPFTDEVPQRLRAMDHAAWDQVQDPDPDAFFTTIRDSHATICGRNTLLLLTALLEGTGAQGTELQYTTSGVITGDWTNSVSYLAGRLDGPVWAGKGPAEGAARLVSPDTGEALRRLSESVLRHWYATGEVLEVDPSTLPEGADRVLGAFVTLEEGGQLRGCIGEIEPRRAVWRAVVDHALDAALRDPRFPPVSANELPQITVELSLLGPSWRASSAQDFIIGRHGIVLSLGGRRATYLPQVAPDQGWDRQTTLRYLARKAGIPADRIPDAQVGLYEAQVIRPSGTIPME